MADRPWNIVTMGDGSTARLVPRGCLNRRRNEDGSVSCNHGDLTPCDLPDHETISLYEIEIIEGWPE